MPWVVVLDDNQTFALIDGCRVVFAEDNLEEAVSNKGGILISDLLQAELARRAQEVQNPDEFPLDVPTMTQTYTAYPVNPLPTEEQQRQIDEYIAEMSREREERDRKFNAEIIELLAQIPDGVLLQIEYSGGGDSGHFEGLQVLKGSWNIPKAVGEMAYEIAAVSVAREFGSWADNDGGYGVVLFRREGMQLLHEQEYRETTSEWRQGLVAENLNLKSVVERWDEENTVEYTETEVEPEPTVEL